MQSFKGLISKALTNDQGSGIINKRNDEFKKMIQHSSDVALSLLKIYQIYLYQMPKLLDLLSVQAEGNTTPCYSALRQTYEYNYKQLQSLILDYMQTPVSELTNSNTQKLMSFSSCLLAFQKQFKSYCSSESSIMDMAKKYFKSQKYLITSIQSYKQSFTQAKLIYNMDGKLKRYSTCQQNYKAITQEHACILQNKQKLQNKKMQIIRTFQNLTKQQNITQKQVDLKLFTFLSKFNQNICQNIKKRININKQGIKKVQQSSNDDFFNGFIFQQISQQNNNQNRNEVESRNRRKAQNIQIALKKRQSQVPLQNLKKLVAKFQKQLQIRKLTHIKMYEFHLQFYKTAQKKISNQLKQVLVNVQKMKKKMKQQFSNQTNQQLKYTYQIIRITSQAYIEVQKKIGSKIGLAGQSIQQMKMILKNLNQQVHQISQKSDNKQAMQILNYKQKITNINTLIKNYDNKLKTILSNLKQMYSDVLNIYLIGLIDTFGKVQTIGEISSKSYIDSVTAIKNRKIDRLRSTAFSELLNQQSKCKIVFQDEIQKTNSFKKLKKPVQIEIIGKNKEDKDINKEQIDKQQCILDEGQERQEDNSPTKVKIKHKLFLQTKISYVQGQQLLRTFSCALADKIILQGRLYVTNQRICFYSNFNPNTLFFGQTFIQIPKKDIIALQKRKNGIFFDNSISITTVKGQLFLTSFLKRNQALSLISQVSGIHRDDQAYEQDNTAFESDTSEVVQKSIEGSKIQQSPPLSIQNYQNVQQNGVQQEDDIKNQQLQSRQKIIQKALGELNFPFKESARAQFNIKGLNAFKLMHIMYLQGQLTILSKKYTNFVQYIKKTVQFHKDIQISPFTPNINEYLNKNNIKQNCPIKFNRIVTSTVPTPPSNIPFVPKFTKTHQSQTLYIISKDKWIVDNEVQSSGAPYTDSFKVYFRTICQSNDQSCTIYCKLHINFIKSVMVKGIIEGKTTQQSAAQFKKQYDELRKFLNQYMKPKKIKATAVPILSTQKSCPQSSQIISSISANNQQNSIIKQEQDELIKQLQQRIQELSQKNKLSQQQGQKIMKKYRVMLIGSLIVNLILILLLIL